MSLLSKEEEAGFVTSFNTWKKDSRTLKFSEVLKNNSPSIFNKLETGELSILQGKTGLGLNQMDFDSGKFKPTSDIVGVTAGGKSRMFVVAPTSQTDDLWKKDSWYDIRQEGERLVQANSPTPTPTPTPTKPAVAPVSNTASATEQTNNTKNSSPAPATSSSGGGSKLPASAPPIATPPEEPSGQNSNTGKPAATSPKAKVSTTPTPTPTKPAIAPRPPTPEAAGNNPLRIGYIDEKAIRAKKEERRARAKAGEALGQEQEGRLTRKPSPIKIEGMSTTMFTSGGETLTDHNNNFFKHGEIASHAFEGKNPTGSFSKNSSNPSSIIDSVASSKPVVGAKVSGSTLQEGSTTISDFSGYNAGHANNNFIKFKKQQQADLQTAKNKKVVAQQTEKAKQQLNNKTKFTGNTTQQSVKNSPKPNNIKINANTITKEVTNTHGVKIKTNSNTTLKDLEPRSKVIKRKKPPQNIIKGSSVSGQGGYSQKQSTATMASKKTVPYQQPTFEKEQEKFAAAKQKIARAKAVEARAKKQEEKAKENAKQKRIAAWHKKRAKSGGVGAERPSTFKGNSLQTVFTPANDIKLNKNGRTESRMMGSSKAWISPKDISKNEPKGLLNNGKHLSSNELEAETRAQAEERSKGMSKTRMDPVSGNDVTTKLGRFDPEADARTAGYLGLNTDVGQEVTEEAQRTARGMKVAQHAPGMTPGLDHQYGTTSSYLTEANAGSLVNTKMPGELAGISNLGEADANAYGRAYNQSLVNNRIGRKAGFEDLKINDITMTDRVTGKQIAGAALSNHTVASVAGYGSRSLTTGYGMGWGNAWRASRSEHAIRAISVVNPLSRGNISGALETLGRTTTLDHLKFKANPGAANRFAAAASPAFAAGTLAFGMYDNQDMGELATNFLLPAVAIPSARVGIALGGMITPAKTAKNFGVIRGLGLAGGAVGGFVAGAAAVIGVSAGIRDVTSNTSSIRSMSKKIATSEVFVQDNNSRQSLTARQMSLNKLSRSGLNDRALLLSNEAAQLKGVL